MPCSSSLKKEERAPETAGAGEALGAAAVAEAEEVRGGDAEGPAAAVEEVDAARNSGDG
jgi:hypothetical protein